GATRLRGPVESNSRDRPTQARVLPQRGECEQERYGCPPHRGPPTLTGPGLIVIGIVTVSVEELPPPRVAATIPPAKPAAPTTTRIFHRLLRLLACGPPSSPLSVLLLAMVALVLVVPDVAVT